MSLQTLKDSEFQILRIAGLGSESFNLVIPSIDLQKGIFNNRRRQQSQIYIPLGEPPDNPIFDFRRYESAWHLLERSTSSRRQFVER